MSLEKLDLSRFDGNLELLAAWTSGYLRSLISNEKQIPEWILEDLKVIVAALRKNVGLKPVDIDSDEEKPKPDPYECSYCLKERDRNDGEPEVHAARWSSDDGLPTVVCPQCTAAREDAGR